MMESINFSQLDSLNTGSLELISLDFFDTLIWRLESENDVLRQCFDKLLPSSVEFHKFIQLKDENEALIRYQNSLKYGDKEATLREIYLATFSSLQLSSDLAYEFCDLVVEEEANNLVLHCGVKAFLAQLAKSMRVCIISDTYYSKEDFEKFFNKLGLDDFTLPKYLSCECRYNKASGNLFKYVLKELDITQENWLHIGDNRFSDVEMAKSIGGNSLWFKSQYSITQLRTIWNFGEQYFGPVLSDFIDMVLEYTPGQLVFLGRDGFVLNKIAQRKGHNNGKYLYINRAIANQLAFDSFTTRVINYVSVEHKSEGIWGLVSVFGLSSSSFSAYLEEVLAQSKLDKRQLLTPDLTEQLLADIQLGERFKESIELRRSNAIRYLNQHVNLTRNLTLVDIGWRGQIRDKIAEVVDGEVQLHLFCNTQPSPDINAYISANNDNSNALEPLTKLRPLIEFFVGESIGSVKYIDDNAMPVFSEFSASYIAKLVQAAIFKSIDKTTLSESIQGRAQRLAALCKCLSSLSKDMVAAISGEFPDLDVEQQTQLSFSDILSSVDQKSALVGTKAQDSQQFIYRFLQKMYQLKQDSPLVLYGAGSGMEFVLGHLRECCVGIVDINPSLHGERIEGIEIFGLDRLNNFDGKILVTVLGRKSILKTKLAPYSNNIEFLEDLM